LAVVDSVPSPQSQDVICRMKIIRNIAENVRICLAGGLFFIFFGLSLVLRPGEYTIFRGFPLYHSFGYLLIASGVLFVINATLLFYKLRKNPTEILICPRCQKRYFNDELNNAFCNNCDVQLVSLNLFQKNNPDELVKSKASPLIEPMSPSDPFEFISQHKKSVLICSLYILVGVVLAILFRFYRII
jgi:hypothetical protein